MERLKIKMPLWKETWFKNYETAYEKDWWCWDYNYFKEDEIFLKGY